MCVCVFAHVLLICAYVYLLFVYLYCNIVYTQRMPETGVPLMQTKPTACQPVPRVLVCVCVCTQSIIHAIIDTKQERRSQPAWASLSTTTAATTAKAATTWPEMLLTQFKKLRKICSLFYAAAGNQLWFFLLYAI